MGPIEILSRRLGLIDSERGGKVGSLCVKSRYPGPSSSCSARRTVNRPWWVLVGTVVRDSLLGNNLRNYVWSMTFRLGSD